MQASLHGKEPSHDAANRNPHSSPHSSAARAAHQLDYPSGADLPPHSHHPAPYPAQPVQAQPTFPRASSLVYSKAKDSPPYLANSAFTYAQGGAFQGKGGAVPVVPTPVAVSLPSNVTASSILSPLTMGTSTPTSSGLHRPQARLSPANSFTNLAALVPGGGQGGGVDHDA